MARLTGTILSDDDTFRARVNEAMRTSAVHVSVLDERALRGGQNPDIAVVDGRRDVSAALAVTERLRAGAPSTAGAADACPADQMILDVGPKSIELYNRELAECATLVWNGPPGAFELHPFEKATVELARYAAQRTKAGKLISVAGGGDTVAALNMAGVADDFTYVSTAGGAFLEWMEGKPLPGVEVLRQK